MRRGRTGSGDHPRTRGDKGWTGRKETSWDGSPPHTRGQGRRGLHFLQFFGITPAHAGTSRAARSGRAAKKDHPRTRGDKVTEKAPQQIWKGSPPHTRGQASHQKLTGWHKRITPAHAGTRNRCGGKLPVAWDHPRTRGDKGLPGQCSHSSFGSPPHTRGQENLTDVTQEENRITPAHAGTRRGRKRGRESMKDHPRTRGDKWSTPTKRARPIGSPPHTRGQGKMSSFTADSKRITPAHAGTSALVCKFQPPP